MKYLSVSGSVDMPQHFNLRAVFSRDDQQRFNSALCNKSRKSQYVFHFVSMCSCSLHLTTPTARANKQRKTISGFVFRFWRRTNVLKVLQVIRSTVHCICVICITKSSACIGCINIEITYGYVTPAIDLSKLTSRRNGFVFVHFHIRPTVAKQSQTHTHTHTHKLK